MKQKTQEILKEFNDHFKGLEDRAVHIEEIMKAMSDNIRAYSRNKEFRPKPEDYEEVMLVIHDNILGLWKRLLDLNAQQGRFSNDDLHLGLQDYDVFDILDLEYGSRNRWNLHELFMIEGHENVRGAMDRVNQKTQAFLMDIDKCSRVALETITRTGHRRIFSSYSMASSSKIGISTVESLQDASIKLKVWWLTARKVIDSPDPVVSMYQEWGRGE
jgi:hypothetical protein